MEEAVGPPEAKRSRVKDSPEDNRDNQCVDLGGEDQDITVSHHGLAGRDIYLSFSCLFRDN